MSWTDPERSGGRRRWSGAVIAALWALAPPPALAAVEPSPPSFFIERIEIVTERLSPQIVLSESRLDEGRAYDEAELREALHRVQRLPFVLSADLSLARGSARDRYLLRIEIVEARRWFFRFDGDWTTRDELFSLDPSARDGRVRPGFEPSEENALAGRRFALGRRSLLFATVGGSDGLFAVGLQRYDLFDRDVVLSLTVGADDAFGDADGFDDPIWRGELRLGIPIRGDHAVRIGLEGSYWKADLLGDLELRRDTTEAEVVWIYNSLDDPVTPRSGDLFEAGPLWSQSRGRSTVFDLTGRLTTVPFEEDRLGLRALAARWWPVGRRHSVSAGARGYLADSSVGTGDFRELEAKLGYEVFLLRDRRPGRWRELRFETELSRLSQRAPGFDGAVFDVETNRLRTGLVLRHRWGLYRFFLDYVDRSDLP